MIAIDKNIPIPAPHNVNGRPGIYPWHEMEIGDSFAITSEDPKKTRNQLSASAQRGSIRKTGRKFTIRVVTENDKQIVRVWRIA